MLEIVYKRTVKKPVRCTFGDASNRQLSDFGEYEATVGTTEAKIVFERDIDLHVAGNIRTIIQIAFRILIEDVDSGWRYLMVNQIGRAHV